MGFDAFRSLDQQIGRPDKVAFLRDDVCLPECQFLERSGHIDPVIFFKKYTVRLFKIRRFNQIVWISAGIPRLEKGRGKRMCYRMSDQTEFHEFLCLTASNMRMAADTETFRESSLPSIGIFMWASAAFLHTFVSPVASVPMTMAVPPFMSVS